MVYFKRIALAAGSIGLMTLGAGRYLSIKRRERQRATYPHPEALVIPLEEAIRVERQSDDRLRIAWAQPATATIYSGLTPDSIDRTQPLAQAEGVNHIVIDQPVPGRRLYFEVVLDGIPHTVAERRLPLHGVANLRDIGGYKTEDGRQVRWGMIYRSGSVTPQGNDAQQYLEQLNIRLICDLRSEKEMIAHPDQPPQNPAPQQLHLPMSAGDNDLDRLKTLLWRPEHLYKFLADAYIDQVIEAGAGTFKQLLEHLAAPQSLPALIHCTAGKDRTGISIALVLSVLGVPRETIIADYSLSNYAYAQVRDFMQQKMENPLAAVLGVKIEDFMPMLTAHPDMLRHALAHIDTQYGSVEAYLTERVGLTPDTLQALRDALLV